jgi:hypothetical protein
LLEQKREGSNPHREALFEALIRDRDDMVEEIRQSTVSLLPAYEVIPTAEFRTGICTSITASLDAMRADDPAVAKAHFERLAPLSRQRMAQSIPLHDMVRAWDIGVRVVVDHSRRIGRELRLPESAVLDFVDAVIAKTDQAHDLAATALRDAGEDHREREEMQRSAFVVALLQGSLPPAVVVQQGVAFGIDTSVRYLAIRAHECEDPDARSLRSELGFDQAHLLARSMATTLDGDLIGFVATRPDAVSQGVVGIGPPRTLSHLSESFRAATRSLSTALAFSLTGVHDMTSLGVRPAVAADEEVGAALYERYLGAVRRDPAGDELVASVRTYFEVGVHVGRAAKALFVHPNTVRYRIARFEALADANLRDHNTSFEVWWALEYDALMPQRGHVGD